MRKSVLVVCLGIVLVGQGSSYGITAGTQTSPDAGNLQPGNYVWQPQVAPTGPVVLVVDLAAQTMQVYRGGELIGRSTVGAGETSHPTPTGIFTILEKKLVHHSTKYHEASMPYMERLTWDGVAIHAGNVLGKPDSHGCVHVPMKLAQKLYDVTARGATVLITPGTAPSPAVASPGEPQPGAQPPAGDASTPSQPGTPATQLNSNALAAVPPSNEPAPPSDAGAAPMPSASSNAAASLPPAKPDLEFSSGKPSPVSTPSAQVPDSWHPEAARSGPMCVVYSSADQRVYVYRNGVEIGVSNVGQPGAAPQVGDRVYAAEAAASPGAPAAWKLLGSVQLTPAPDAEATLGQLQLAADFSRKLRAAITPGTTLVLTDEPVDKKAASGIALFDTQSQ